jgi:hypothetical protein
MKFQVASLLFFLGIAQGRLHSASTSSIETTRKLAGQGQLDVSNDVFEVSVNGTCNLVLCLKLSACFCFPRF